jgi:hypothetical protein
MSDPVALALIAGVVTLGTAFLGAWGRRMATQLQAAAAEASAPQATIPQQVTYSG